MKAAPISPAPLNGDGSRGFGNGDAAYWLSTQIIPLIHQPDLSDEHRALLQAINMLVALADEDAIWEARDAVGAIATRCAQELENRVRAAAAVHETRAITRRAPFRVLEGGQASARA